MGKVGKIFAVILILIMTIASLSLLMAKPAFAQSTPKPSVPEFTIKYVDRSYDIKTYNSTNPYTGETIIHPGYHVENQTIDVIIKNQPFTSSKVEGNTTGLFYNVQSKNQFENWTNQPHPDNLNKYAVKASTSDYTVVTLGQDIGGWNVGGYINIRVQAVIGYQYNIWDLNGGPIPIAQAFKLVERSDWSPTQTITIPASSISPTPTVPELSWLIILSLLLTIPIILITVRKRL
jgi:hypothetical protein